MTLNDTNEQVKAHLNKTFKLAITFMLDPTASVTCFLIATI